VTADDFLPPPDMKQALATAGMLIHFVASDPPTLEAFRVWVEHHAGDLDTAQVAGYLAGTHALLSPTCEDPASYDYRPERRGTLVLDLASFIAGNDLLGSTDAVIAAWVREHADALRQAIFDATVYRDEHGLPREDDRDYGPLAEQFSEIAAEGLTP
jgi:hypothetical protein